ncbi:MAG: hypothetical protein EZS28_027236 [Streblomastix strix]|uniref:Uncharacterized protein n=1 Tax=Streblomastix strix TaxID=222440 RepID=A0A5J4V484_9EUKA|nr:MAG: hypothetical protein EZS28_027236 [Streblomastix strix]
MKFMGKEEESKEHKIVSEEELKDNIEILIRKEQIEQLNLTFIIRKTIGKLRKIVDAKAMNIEIADFHFKMHASNEVKQIIRFGDWRTSLDHSSLFNHLIVQTESQPYLALEFLNNNYRN